MDHDTLLEAVIDARYRLDRVIGRGATGVVYQAAHVRLHDRPCALKVLKMDNAIPQTRQRFARELEIISRIRSPYIVEVLDSGSLDDGRPFIVMELLDGETIADRLEWGSTLDPACALTLTRQILEGLQTAHSNGIIHRDLKPANVFLVTRGDEIERACILDFGLAKDIRPNAGPALTAQGAVVGTPTYMSPEQFRRVGVDARIDLYAVGCLLYYMLTGRPPFRYDDPVPEAIAHMPSISKLAWLHINQPPKAVDGLPPALWGFMKRLLAKSPDDRYPDAASALEALADIDLERPSPDEGHADTVRMDSDEMAQILSVPPDSMLSDAAEHPDSEAPPTIDLSSPETPAWRRAMIWWIVGVTAVAALGAWIALK